MLIRSALPGEARIIQELIHELAVFEKAPESAQATLAHITDAFFSPSPAVFCDFVLDDAHFYLDKLIIRLVQEPFPGLLNVSALG